MNTNHPDDRIPDEFRIPDELRWALRGLRRDDPPANDLWPGIAARLQAAATPTELAVSRNRRRNRFVPAVALAASVALAVGLSWQQRAAVDPVAEPGIALISAEADAMTLEYQAALRELQSAAPPRATATTALQELDRSAAQIRTALTRDPEARFLLDRLQHTYARRLELTQRLALS